MTRLEKAELFCKEEYGLTDEEIQSVGRVADSYMLAVGMPGILFPEVLKAEAKKYARIKSIVNGGNEQ